MIMMSLLHLLPLGKILFLEYVDISSEFFHESLNSWVLDWEKSVNMDQMIPERYLVLIVGFIKIFI